jgi:hypothetical protein
VKGIWGDGDDEREMAIVVVRELKLKIIEKRWKNEKQQ